MTGEDSVSIPVKLLDDIVNNYEKLQDELETIRFNLFGDERNRDDTGILGESAKNTEFRIELEELKLIEKVKEVHAFRKDLLKNKIFSFLRIFAFLKWAILIIIGSLLAAFGKWLWWG
jgi:hypothetical protein